MTPTYKIILNPAAGNNNGQKAQPLIEQQLKQHNLTYDLVRTGHPGHGIELTRQAVKDGFAAIIAAGGDGTANEVVNGLQLSRQDGLAVPPIGLLCVGRGNDFAGSLGLPEDIVGGVQGLLAGGRRTVDIGRVVAEKVPQGRYFCNCVGVGFDAITTIEVHKLPRWGGFLAFMLGVLKTVFLYNKAPLARIE